ncbi:MAG: hypothetical protein Q9174_005346, partial [Haloplaca sp. 1 TL-2023]
MNAMIFTIVAYTARGGRVNVSSKDHPNRSKHALQQQYSIMKRAAPPRRSIHSMGKLRNSTLNASAYDINGLDGSVDDKTADAGDEDSSEEDDDEDVDVSPTKVVDAGEDSDESNSPRKTRSARNPRLSKHLSQLAKPNNDDEANDSEQPETPKSTRPKRAGAQDKDYNLLHSVLFGAGIDPAADAEPANGERRSKVVTLRTGIPKKHLTPPAASPRRKSLKQTSPKHLSPRTKTTRKAASTNGDQDVEKSPVHDEAPRRMSTRYTEAINEKSAHSEHDDNPSLGSPLRKRRRQAPSKLYIEQETFSDSQAAAKKRKLSTVTPNESVPTPVSAKSKGSEDPDGQKSVKIQRQSKPRPELGFLPNGQPRKRRKRRTREEMMLAEAKAYTRTDPAISRRRSQYQFPHLEGYMGPPPPDEKTILARQEEHERLHPLPESSSSEDESSSSLDSLDDEDDDGEAEVAVETNERHEEPIEDATENPTEQMNLDIVFSDAPQATQPDPDPQPAATVEDSTAMRIPAAQTTPDDDTDTSEIPEFVFTAEALDLARDKAARRRARRKQQQEKNTNTEEILKQFQTSLSEEMKKTTDLQAELAAATAASAKLSQELASEREPAAAKQKKIEMTEKENSQLRQINRKGEEQFNQLSAANNAANAEVARLREELRKSTAAISTPDLPKSEDLDKKTITMSKPQHDILQSQNRTLKARNSDLAHDLEKAKGDAQRKCAGLSAELEEKTKECNQLKSVTTEEAKNMAQLKETITQLEMQIETDRKEIQRLRSSNTPILTHALPPRPSLPYPPSPALSSSNAASNNGNGTNGNTTTPNNLTTPLTHLRASHIRMSGALKSATTSHK